MRRWLVLLVVALLVMPRAAMAQDATPAAASLQDLTPSAADLGIGWVILQTNVGEVSDFDVSRRSIIYAGPKGARILIMLSQLPESFSGKSTAWVELQSVWQSWANYYANPDLSESQRQDVGGIQSIPPGGVSDAIRASATIPTWAMSVGTGLYLFESGPAAIVILEGEIDGWAGARGTDYIVEIMVARVCPDCASEDEFWR